MGTHADGWHVDYDRAQHQTYAQGRQLAPDIIQLWVDAVAAHAPASTTLVVDVGAGTGRFSPALAEALQAPVFAIEPSARMREQAASASGHPRVSYVAGAAEQLPVASGVADVVFLSMVAHHIVDLDRAAGEIARIASPQAIVAFRSVFRGRMAAPLFRYFPRALEIEDARAPAVDEVIEAFAIHGFGLKVLDTVYQQTDVSLAAHHARLSQRSLSVFEFLTEDEIARGLQALHDDAQADVDATPVHEPIDLLVLSR